MYNNILNKSSCQIKNDNEFLNVYPVVFDMQKEETSYCTTCISPIYHITHLLRFANSMTVYIFNIENIHFDNENLSIFCILSKEYHRKSLCG